MIDLIIADDHVVLREALCELLETKGKYKIMGQASDGEELLALLISHKPDLVILDVTMPKVDGLAALEQLAEQGPLPPVLVLSANEGESKVRAALKAGAKGYLPKNAKLQELEFAISSLLEGRTYLSPSITDLLVNRENNGQSFDDPLAILTARERQIMMHIANGMPNREIGSMLKISTRTVDTHRSNILKKLNLRTNAELVKMAISHGLIQI
jgi:DNA-binding NarL/FixJ family response regulator